MKDLHNKGQYDLSQSPEEYEKIIVKLEAEVRNHISVQQQMKLYIESYQAKVEELEPLEDKAKEMETHLSELKKKNKAFQKEVEELNTQLNKNKQKWDSEKSQLKKYIAEKEKEYDHKLKEIENEYRGWNHKHEQSVDIPESQK